MLNPKAIPQMNSEQINSGRIKRSRGMPADLMATSSNVSPRLPKVMMEESSTARGRASGTRVAQTYKINRPMVNISRPFPTMSSIYSQKNCSTNTKTVIKKVAMNGPMNALIMSLSSFFITEQK